MVKHVALGVHQWPKAGRMAVVHVARPVAWPAAGEPGRRPGGRVKKGFGFPIRVRYGAPPGVAVGPTHRADIQPALQGCKRPLSASIARGTPAPCSTSWGMQGSFLRQGYTRLRSV